MDERSIVAKVIKYLQSQPQGSKLTYGQIASAIDIPREAGRIKRIIRRSDSPYFRPVLGGVKAIGLGSKSAQKSRRIAMSQRRGFLRKIFEADPEATMRPKVSFEGGRINLGQNDTLDSDGSIEAKKSNPSNPPSRPNIDLTI
jgi:alkylated DNA nucleotide flippase Atl1